MLHGVKAIITKKKKKFWMERAMRGVRTKMMGTDKDRRRQKQNVRAGAAEGMKIFAQVVVKKKKKKQNSA